LPHGSHIASEGGLVGSHFIQLRKEFRQARPQLEHNNVQYYGADGSVELDCAALAEFGRQGGAELWR